VNLVIAVLLSSYDELMVKAEEKELACENERKIIQVGFCNLQTANNLFIFSLALFYNAAILI